MTSSQSSKIQIAAVGIPPLALYAISKALDCSSDRYVVNDFPSVDALPHDPGCIVITAGLFIAHLQELLPRRHKVVIFTDTAIRLPSHSRETPAIISLYDSPETVANRIGQAGGINGSRHTAAGSLTAREKEVLRHLAEGLTIKEIAARLEISANTALTHRKNISAKLGIRSVSGLSLYAMINGIIHTH